MACRKRNQLGVKQCVNILIMTANVNFDLNATVDIKGGINQIGDEDNFYIMMEKFEELSLSKNLPNFKTYYETCDYKLFRDEAHSLKGASSYLAAGKVFCICYKLQQAYDQKQYEEEMSYYPQLIEEIIHLRVTMRKILSSKKGTDFMRNTISRNSFRF